MNSLRTVVYINIILLATLLSCDSSSNSNTKKSSPRIKSLSKIDSPKSGSTYSIGDEIPFSISTTDNTVGIDSFTVKSEINILVLQGEKWKTSQVNPGIKKLSVSVYLDNGKVEKKKISVTMLSDIIPTKFTYRLINTFPHDTDAYTQGLIIENGRMFESTGQKSFSTLREVEINTGKVKRSIDISSQYFGEGIGLIGDQIFMLTYKSRTGMIFDKESFEEKGKFNYSTEGWGMSSAGDTLIMSDGSNLIKFRESISFAILRKVEVYDRNGPIDNLNELEYVDGQIFANRYQSNIIYLIDSKSGKVTGTLDLTGIFDQSNYRMSKKPDVLNGIAYNKDTDTFFVTGKWWPNLFEIRLISQENI